MGCGADDWDKWEAVSERGLMGPALQVSCWHLIWAWTTALPLSLHWASSKGLLSAFSRIYAFPQHQAAS